MKNNDKKKHCKNCNEITRKKVKTMENGKKYYEEVEKKEIENNDQEQNDNE